VRGRTLVAGAVLALALAAAATGLVLASDHAESKAATISLAVTVGLTFALSGLFALWRRPDNRTGLLLAAVGYLWFLGALAVSDNSWLFTLGAILGNLAFGAFVHLLLAFPWGHLSGARDRFLVVATYVLAVAGNTLFFLVDEQPDSDCVDCRSVIAVTDSSRLEGVVQGVWTVLVLALVVAILWVVAMRFRLASAALRRVLAPVLAAGALSMITLGASLVAEPFSATVGERLYYAFLLVFATVPIAFLAGIMRSRLARSAVGDLLLELGSGAPLRDALAQALHDPSLDVVYWLPERGVFVWHDGNVFHDEGGPRTARYVERNGRRVGAILHDPSLEDEPELVDSVAAAAGLWLENAQLQAELRAQFSFLEAIVNTAPALLLSLDPDGRIANLNVACRKAAGVDDDEQVRWRYWWDVFVSDEERDEVKANFAAAAPTFEPITSERSFTNLRGEQRTIAWSAAPLHDEEGSVKSIVCGGLDMTVRRRKELELQVERDFADTLANTIPVLLAVVDENGLISDPGPNRAFADVLGWPSEQIVGRNLLELIDDPDEYRALMAIASAANGVPAAERESQWRCHDGTTRAIAWTTRQILGLDGRISVLVSGVDVTERHLQEKEVRASRQRIVEAADAARRRLERNLHDGAQQRLVALSVTLRLAESQLARDPAAAANALAGAQKELTLALDELRELARGIHPAILTDRGLDAALDALAARSPVPVAIAVENVVLPTAVEAAAYYVVAEALANVVKYADATHVTVHVGRQDGSAYVEVADDGRGGADPAAGSGLRGLADRVAALDGTLAVVSPPGAGTRIRAEVPVTAGPA
jgi:PAS domain S-box-containing protein